MRAERAAQLLEAVRGLRESDELAGADGGEVRRMGEEEEPPSSVVAEGAVTHRRAGVEVRCRIVKERWSAVSLLCFAHGPS